MSRLFEEFQPVSTADWEAQIARDLKGRDPKTLVTKTADGIEVKPFYRSEDLAGIAPRELYSSNSWKICCEVTDAESAKYAVSRGAVAVYIESGDLNFSDVEVVRGDSPDLLHIQGATAAEELAFAIGHPSSKALLFPVGSDYFLEIAKFRAARVLWKRIADAPVLIYARTSKRNQTIYDPYVNLLRGTTEAMSAIIGGCDLLIVRPFDAAYENPGEFSRRMSINTQLILRDESYFKGMPDPAAGCWYLEWLSDQLVKKAWEFFESGVKASGKSRPPVFVGVTRYVDGKDRALDRLKIEPDEQRDPWKIEKLRLATEQHAKATGKTPLVFLLRAGDRKMSRARADFSANFFAAAGFAISEGDLDAMKQQHPDLVVLCSSDPEYPDLARDLGPSIDVPLIIAGTPPPGFPDSISIRSNQAETLAAWQQKLGIVQ